MPYLNLSQAIAIHYNIGHPHRWKLQCSNELLRLGYITGYQDTVVPATAFKWHSSLRHHWSFVTSPKCPHISSVDNQVTYQSCPSCTYMTGCMRLWCLNTILYGYLFAWWYSRVQYHILLHAWLQWRIQNINQHFNSLWPSDTIWRHRFGSTLAQVMACCLTAPSHYLNQCWLNMSMALWHSAEKDFTRNAQDIYPWYQFENYWFKTLTTSSRGQWVNTQKAPHTST